MSSEFPMSIAHISEYKAKAKNHQTNDFPMSQFDEEGSNSQPQSQKMDKNKSSRKYRVVALSTVFVGILAAISTGHLHSDLPLFTQLRSQYDQTFFSNEKTEIIAETGTLDGLNSSTPQLGEESNTNGLESAGSELLTTTSASSAIEAGNNEKVSSQQTSNLTAEVQPAATSDVIPPIPSSISSGDLEKLMKSFIDQGTQMNAVEEQLIRLMEMHSSPEKVKSAIEALERRHQTALQNLKTIGSKKMK